MVSVSPMTGPESPLRVTVPSSRGAGSYVVERDEAGFWTCTCPGFSYRRRCRHLDLVQDGGALSLARVLGAYQQS